MTAITANAPALFTYPDDAPIVVDVLSTYNVLSTWPNEWVIRRPDGVTLAAQGKHLTALDAATLDAMTHGFVRALLGTRAQPLAPYNVDGDDEHGWAVVGPDGYVGERFATFQDAQSYAEGRNEEDDDYTDETGGLENREPTAELTAKARGLCARFLAANADDITAHMDALGDPDGAHPGEFVGHTFCLDAGGSGVNFTDRAWRDDDPMTKVCERLNASAETFPEVEHLDAYELPDGTVDIG